MTSKPTCQNGTPFINTWTVNMIWWSSEVSSFSVQMDRRLPNYESQPWSINPPIYLVYSGPYKLIILIVVQKLLLFYILLPSWWVIHVWWSMMKVLWCQLSFTSQYVCLGSVCAMYDNKVTLNRVCCIVLCSKPHWQLHHNSGELREVLERKLPPFGRPQSGIIR